MISMVFFGSFVVKQAPQEILIQILDAVNSFINNPLFTEYGRIGLFINGVFSTFIPFPPEVTAISLVLAGNSRTEIFVILVTSWIIGAAVGYYAGLSGKKLAEIFKGRRKETEKPGEEDADNSNKALVGYDHEINNDATNDGRLNKKKKDQSHQSRYRQLLERYGWAIIFVAPWIPVLGDIIPAIAGAKRYDVKKFMIAISAGKTVRAVATIFLGSYLGSVSMPPWI
ncbi:MAG TPA: VTT domain-containing protein [Nitrososphaera sp.]|jgi:membrane protein YqaA with SNARE-associated domain|nr:VTT domain-containing protein [Nitrososphaera sp.]